MNKKRAKPEDKILFIRSKEEENTLYVYVFNSKDTKIIITDRIEQRLNKNDYKSDYIEVWYHYADIFKIKDNKEIEHISSGHPYTIHNLHGVYHPNEKEIRKYMNLIKEGIKQINNENFQKRIRKLKETYAPVVEYVKYFRDCYTTYKGDETKIVKDLSEKIIDIADRYRINDIRFKLLVYGKTYSSVTANKDIRDFITEHIVSQIINNKSLSVTNIKSTNGYDAHVVIERKSTGNSWCIHLDVTNDSNTDKEMTNAISISKKGNEGNLVVKISDFVNKTFDKK